MIGPNPEWPDCAYGGCAPDGTCDGGCGRAPRHVTVVKYLDDVMVEMVAKRERERAIRAVVAAQWVEAFAMNAHETDLRDGDPFDDEMFPTSGDDLRRRVAALPTPEQIVDGDV